MSNAYAFDQLAPVATLGGPGGPSADEVAHAIEAARAEGFAQGHATAVAELQAGTAAAEEALRAVAAAVDAERGALADRVEHAAVTLALRIAEQAVRATVAANPELVLEAVRGALRRLVERERVIVLVNPDDLEVVRGGLGAMMDQLGGVGHWEVQAERRVARGGAVVRTAEGEVDGSLDTKLQRAREVLDDELLSGDR